jgi:uncharacterized protein (DUF433 family)
MTGHPRITLDPEVLAGKPIIRGTRLAVGFVIGLMADEWSEADVPGNYPGVRTTTSSRVPPMRGTR